MKRFFRYARRAWFFFRILFIAICTLFAIACNVVDLEDPDRHHARRP